MFKQIINKDIHNFFDPPLKISSVDLIFRICSEAKTDLFWASIEDWQGKPVTGRALVTLASG